MAETYLLGVDTGGTFTDFVLWHDDTIRIHKCLSTPAAPEKAILQGIDELGLQELNDDDVLYVVHGSTVATNAILEGKGANTAFITNRGFGDMLTIGRQTRTELYNLQPTPVAPPVARACCLETGGRIAHDGTQLEALTDTDITELMQRLTDLKPHSVAINLLFSYVDAKAEQQIAQAIKEAFSDEIFISRSSAVLPEYKEYERGMTTWLNAYVGPLVENYLQRLCHGLAKHNQNTHVSVMQSSGGTIDAQQAGQQAVHMVLSGPAGGMAAAQFLGQLTAETRLLTFDMGGTSTDVAMIDADIQLTSEGSIGRYPVAIPMVDMHTIGAGGGSIASVDQGGLLKVGPESAGAAPGPACYCKAGTKPTVTDANLVLGRLRADAFLGGNMQLDVQAARHAIASVAEPLGLNIEETALGIISLANEHMAQALRVMSIQRGIDPRALCLMSFGGAGGLHVCALANALGMTKAMVPVHSGVLSALGMLAAPRSRQLSQTIQKPLAQCDLKDIQTRFTTLVQQGQQALEEEGVRRKDISREYSLDIRYLGQAYYLNVNIDEAANDFKKVSKDFHELHEQRYGHALDVELELVNIRLALTSSVNQPELTFTSSKTQSKENVAELYKVEQKVPVLSRSGLNTGTVIHGPALITEMVATTYLEQGWQAKVDKFGNLLLTGQAS